MIAQYELILRTGDFSKIQSKIPWNIRHKIKFNKYYSNDIADRYHPMDQSIYLLRCDEADFMLLALSFKEIISIKVVNYEN
jgi:hypothetical protein